jgi:valyl-tRNA synthetase
MDSKFLKPYNPKETEGRIYKLWEESGYFNPDNLPGERTETFSMVLPPPNVTGTLHTGHSLMLAIEDTITRYARMQNKKTLWVPGTDHAAIATEAVVVKQLAKDKKNKNDLGREEFLKLVDAYAQTSHDTIVTQLKKMGASLDWSREAFTLDDKRKLAVNTAFEQMYADGLIYRGLRVVNWDPKGQTVISDDEVEYKSGKAKLYYFKYDKDFPITIATTRPETKLGDVAVAVNPDDVRYKEYVGKTFDVNFVGVPLSIKIIADRAVDMEFGTGALGVTPAHSQTDWEIAERNNLEKKQVINEVAKISVPGEFEGKKTTEVREMIIEKLQNAGLIEKEEDTDQNVPTSQRTGGIIEPLPKLQWFVNVNKPVATRGNKTLKELMQDSVQSGDIKIMPDNFTRVYFNWIENLRDWCISRQIWYGHRIPVWYKKEGEHEEIKVSATSPGVDWEQDSDTLDTWFSSGLWTFSTLGWPEETADLKTYHPTSMIETGYDIIFFWVARMILMSQYLLGEVPFKKIYLHGMVLDKNGKKMSKSNPETAVDPLVAIEKYGADALRMAMVVGVGAGSDNSLSEDKIKGYGKFANKLWNIARFVSENGTVNEPRADLREEFEKLAQEITEDMDNFRFHLASEKIYHYIWHRFADEIIEESKINSETKSSLMYILENSLKLLHPFMPFVTEEIWQTLGKSNLLIVETWPK